ncbi:hypothetical protein OIU84_023625 [Salix udensis]|uniref:Peptidase A1 domain-containing protein n=1 Tax=Salix udensis TaxID=889485 RepID=A0AAD6KRG7_9ROSI|nr:hypothetical protein OIU84_023625 [Salix udensis]
MKSIISGRNIDDSVDSTLIPLTSGIRIQTLNYIVTLELGGRKMTVIVDTGSDLSWVQCQPCKRCYNQQDPVFNPSTSPSYQTVLCSSPACQSLEFATGNSGVCGSSPPTCNYVVNYGDGSYTGGELSMEHLNLGNSTTVNNFIFGCGRNNQGLFGGASGLVGLGRSSLSLISQTSAMFGGVFSYCLPITEAESSGSLIMGGNSSRGRFPSAPAFMILDTCFNLSGYQETDASQVCLAVASLSYENEVGIIGNYQQKNQRVIYDTKGSMLGFAAEACSFD